MMFAETTNQVIVDLEPTVTEDQILVCLDEEKVATTKVQVKKTHKKRASDKVIEEVSEGDKTISSSFELDDVFDVNYIIPSRRRREKEYKSSKGLVLLAFSSRLCRKLIAEEKVDRVDERLDKLEKLCSDIQVLISIMKATIERKVVWEAQEAKIGILVQ